jgi:hypothetical protein
MGTSFTPELIRLLTASGCYFERHGKGDHDIWYSPITNLFVWETYAEVQLPKALLEKRQVSTIF